MITSSTQLKAKIRNLSGNDSKKAQTLIRIFIMERFLERVCLSKYRNNFILKGGMLVASIVGLDTRATMDIDTTVSSIHLTKENAARIIEEIISIELPDKVHFQINRITDIMELHNYPGIRLTLDATMDNLRQSIKVDISTGDVITPNAVEYNYKLIFEDRSIHMWTYNLETLLAEKLETIMARGLANTRMRDFYDIHIIGSKKEYKPEVLKSAFLSTCKARSTLNQIPGFSDILIALKKDSTLIKQWNLFRANSFFVKESWEEVMESVQHVASVVI